MVKYTVTHNLDPHKFDVSLSSGVNYLDTDSLLYVEILGFQGSSIIERKNLYPEPPFLMLCQSSAQVVGGRSGGESPAQAVGGKVWYRVLHK